MWVERPRIARLYGDINQASALAVIEDLLALDQISPADPITLHVSSAGGCVVSGFALLDIMRHVRAPIDLVGVGLIASMAAFLFASGSKGRRFLLPHARVMLHGLRGGASGMTAAIRSQVELQSRFEREMEMQLAALTGKSRPAVRRLLAREKFLEPPEVIALGLADGVLEEVR